MSEQGALFGRHSYEIPAADHPPLPRPRVPDDREAAILPRDTHVVEPAEVVNLAGQNAAYLARLKRGPTHRLELQKLGCNVTGRASDLRRAGYTIVVKRSIYTLVEAE